MSMRERARERDALDFLSPSSSSGEFFVQEKKVLTLVKQRPECTKPRSRNESGKNYPPKLKLRGFKSELDDLFRPPSPLTAILDSSSLSSLLASTPRVLTASFYPSRSRSLFISL